MAANRKLQSEIDRTLKKVQEGVEIFDEIWEKVYNAQNQNQKEKFEGELKSQIKKLQRYRDDIKTWITNSDIKDKRPLTDARKLIETEMERFKVCEKEFKTKAFSKEGLASAPKEDPKEKERNKIRKWIAEKLEQLSSQTDAYEVEIESLATSSKKKKKDNSAQKWEDLIERCRLHEAKLEVVLRLIDNETLSAEDVEPIMEQLDYLLEQMVEGNLEEVDSIDDESIYEELGLEDLVQPSKEEDVAPEPVAEKASAKDEKRKGRETKEEEERKGRKDKLSIAEPVVLPSINAAAMKAPPPKVNKEPPKPAPKQPVVAAAVPPVAAARAKTAAAAIPAAVPRAAAAARAPATPVAPAPASPVVATAEPQGLFARAAMVPPAQQAAERRAGKEDAAQLLAGGKGLPPPPLAALAPPAGLPPPQPRAVAASSIGSGALAGLSQGAPAASALQLSGGVAAHEGSHAVGCDETAPALAAPAAFAKQPHADDADAAGAASHSRGLPAGLPSSSDFSACADDASTSEGYDADKLGEIGNLGGALPTAIAAPAAAHESQEANTHVLQMLNLSLLNMPEPSDSERPKTYVPRNPYPTPSSFPQTPASVFDAPAVFEKFDVDTLFFIFYYQQGTYQQYLAARELKKQSWRYHKKYLTWFQRHEEPKVTADEYEQGTYVYFDYETGWCQRIKSEFTFEYGFLEDELQV